MRERPIIFTGDSVRAILAGRKTQSRRVVSGFEIKGPNPPGKTFDWYRGDRWVGAHAGDASWCNALALCPYGSAPDRWGKGGSRLWVRESFVIGYPDGRGGYSLIPPTGSTPERDGRPTYRASFCERPDEPRMCWRSPIHMPRWASRLTLEILSVRVERVQAISEADARAEGVEPLPLQAGESGAWWTASVSAGAALHGRTPVDAFRLAWDAINGRRAGCSWRDTPWVWCLSFRRVEA